MRRSGVLVVAGALVLVLLGACSGAGASGGGSIAAAAENGGAGYVAGDGTIEKIAAAERETNIRVQGTTLEGRPLDTATYRGKNKKSRQGQPSIGSDYKKAIVTLKAGDKIELV